MTTVAVPPLAAPRVGRQPSVAERILGNGLRVLAVRRPGVPLVELRLRVPFAGRGERHAARSGLLSQTMLSGTTRMSTVDIAIALQEVGGGLDVSADPDRLMIGGNALAGGLQRLLEVLAEVLTDAAYPREEVAGERNRLVERLRIARSQPAVLAREALLRRLYYGHPYAYEVPEPDAVAAVTAGALRTLHRSRVVPAGSALVVVGDVSPRAALDRIESALSSWEAGVAARGAPGLPRIERVPTLLVDRPGSVQSNIRLGGAALARQDPDYPAMQLANMVFGGYFSSRLVENIREDKGYSYGPRSGVDHGSAGSTLIVEADVATEVTAAALLEIGYELGKVATAPVGQEELDNARQYAIGTLALSTASQAGLANTLTALLAGDLSVDWLREHPRRLAKVTVEEAHEQATRLLAPARLVTVILGDATAVEPSLSTLDEVVRG